MQFYADSDADDFVSFDTQAHFVPLSPGPVRLCIRPRWEDWNWKDRITTITIRPTGGKISFHDLAYAINQIPFVVCYDSPSFFFEGLEEIKPNHFQVNWGT